MTRVRPRLLTEWIESVWRRKALAAVAAVSIAGAAAWVAARVPNVYESRAQVVVVARERQDLADLAPQIAALTRAATSESSLARLVRDLGLYASEATVEARVKRLARDLKVEKQMRAAAPELPEAYAISYRNEHAAVARQVVVRVVASFEEGSVSQRDQLAEQIATVDAKIAQLRLEIAQRTEQKAGAPLLQVPAGDPAALDDQRFALARRIEEQNRLIQGQRRRIAAAPPSTAATTRLLARRDELGERVAEYAQEFSEKHPKMVEARAQLAKINSDLAALEKSPRAGDLRDATADSRDLEALERGLGALTIDLEVLNRQAQRRAAQPAGTLSAAVWGQPNRDAEIGTLLTRHNALLSERDGLERRQASIGPGVLKVIDAPTTPERPVAPNRSVLAASCLALGLGSGIAVALLFELRRSFFITDADDIRYFLDVPVLASIPDVLTREELWRYRRLTAARAVGWLLAAAALAPAAALLLSRLQILHLIGTRY